MLSIGQRPVLNDAQIPDFDPACFGGAGGLWASDGPNPSPDRRLGPVPPWSAIAICQPAVGGGGKGAKGPAPLTPGRWRMPTVGKAPCCGLSSSGREPHAIHGVTLPFAVILTAHRLHSPRRPARQTAWSLGGDGKQAQATTSQASPRR